MFLVVKHEYLEEKALNTLKVKNKTKNNTFDTSESTYFYKYLMLPEFSLLHLVAYLSFLL